MVPNSAGSVDIKTGPSDAELTGMRPRPPLSVGVGWEGASLLRSQLPPNPGSLSPPSWLCKILSSLGLNRPPQSLCSLSLSLLCCSQASWEDNTGGRLRGSA